MNTIHIRSDYHHRWDVLKPMLFADMFLLHYSLLLHNINFKIICSVIIWKENVISTIIVSWWSQFLFTNFIIEYSHVLSVNRNIFSSKKITSSLHFRWKWYICVHFWRSLQLSCGKKGQIGKCINLEHSVHMTCEGQFVECWYEHIERIIRWTGQHVVKTVSMV